ncbi:serpin family protein [Arthrobacter sp. R4-81]
MKNLRAQVVAVSAALAITACSSSSAPELLKADGVSRVTVERADYETQLLQYRNSALALGTALLDDGGEGGNGNVISSPGSLLIALSMLRSGASGETAAELDRVLGLPEEGRDEGMNALLQSLQKFDGDPGSVDEENPPRTPVMHVANGLFVDKNVPTGPDYVKTLGLHYGTGVYPVEFRDEAATAPALDAWVDKNTGGRIKKAPAAYDPENTFSLLNALYFASAWETPFDANGTADSPFTKANGEEIVVPTMNNLAEMAYAEGPGWQAVDLPYAEGFVMRLVLPATGANGDSLNIGAAELTEIADSVDGAVPEMVEISLPKWDHKSSFELRKVFESLGLQETLSTDKDFDNIQPGMVITQAAQAANITVAEKGTVAAAVTQINGRATSAPPMPDHEIHFDRPFHYQIVHTETGLPLFMGKVADPR